MTAPALKDINAAIANLMVAEKALDDACQVMRLHDEAVAENQVAAHARLGVLLSRFCRLYGERVKIEGDPDLLAAWHASVGEAPAIPGLYRCRACKTLWRLHLDGAWSVAQSAQPRRCCDNDPDFLSRLERA